MAIYWSELQETTPNNCTWEPTKPPAIVEKAKPEQDPWKWGAPFSEDDKLRQKAAMAGIGIDALQTKYIADNPSRFREKNSILGDHPKEGDVDKYFLMSMLGNYLLARLLPPKLRPFFQNATIGTQKNMVQNNANLGIGLKF
jgi:hypothetical protein